LNNNIARPPASGRSGIQGKPPIPARLSAGSSTRPATPQTARMNSNDRPPWAAAAAAAATRTGPQLRIRWERGQPPLRPTTVATAPTPPRPAAIARPATTM
jgi:hypothetical protein